MPQGLSNLKVPLKVAHPQEFKAKHGIALQNPDHIVHCSTGTMWRVFDGGMRKVLKKVPNSQRNLITSIHYPHSE